MTEQKKTAREIALAVVEENYYEYDTIDLKNAIEQAIQAEREETGFWKKETVLHQDALAVFREENLRMREALEHIVKQRGMTMLHDCCINLTCTEVPGEAHCTHQLGVSRGHDNCAQIAEEALASIPETDKYVRLRNAEREVVKAARVPCRCPGCCDKHEDGLCNVYLALEKLAQIEKEPEKKC